MTIIIILPVEVTDIERSRRMGFGVGGSTSGRSSSSGGICGCAHFLFFCLFFIFFGFSRSPVFYWSWQIKNTEWFKQKFAFCSVKKFLSQKIRPKFGGPQTRRSWPTFSLYIVLRRIPRSKIVRLDQTRHDPIFVNDQAQPDPTDLEQPLYI